MGEELKRGMGSLTFWGTTPSYDLLEIFSRNDELQLQPEECQEGDQKKPFEILLLGQSDARHILKTLSIEANEEKRNEFYIVESHPILYARQLLLFHLAFLPLDVMGLHQKITEFMEIFGNTMIRPQTKKTVQKACETLIKLITNPNALAEEMPMINLENLKFRERDVIVEILKFWSDSKLSAAEMHQLWDTRLRQFLTSRYDSRMGVFDYDYQMRVIGKNEDTKIIHVNEYKTWRNSGFAFTEYECDYNQANSTLLPIKGQPYHGDTLIGPFIPYGIHVKDESFFETTNNQFKKKSSELTYYNLEQIFTRLSPKTQADKTEILNNSKIHFLPLDTCENLWKKSKFIGKFDAVHVSCFIGHKITPEMVKLLKSTAIVLIDMPRYVWYFRQENDKAYEKKVLELADEAGLTLSPMKMNDETSKFSNDFLKFEIKKGAKDSEMNPNEPEAPTTATATNIEENIEALTLASNKGAGDV